MSRSGFRFRYRFVAFLLPALALALGVAFGGAAPARAQDTAATGSIGVAINECPVGVGPGENLGACNVNFAVLTQNAFTLATPGGETLTMADANFGDGGFDWSGLEFGTYTLTQTELAPKYDAYQLGEFPANTPATITLSAAAPNATVIGFNFQPAGEPVDTDGDGLSDGLEADLGTNPNDTDSDDDGATDGEEYDAGTDPLDANDVPGQAESSIIVYAATCPVSYDLYNYGEDCDATAGIPFGLGVPASEYFASQTTDANGNAVFGGLDGGLYVLAADLPGDALEDIDIFCSAPGDTEPRPIERNSLTSITVELLGQEELSCSFFVIPADAGQPQPTTAPTAKPSGTAVPVVGLPNTGAGDTATTNSGLTAGWLVVILAGGLVVAGAGATASLARRRA